MALRDLILKVVPGKTAASMEAESREWMARCRTCGYERSIWDLGGLRWKARGNPKTMIRCPQCGRRRWADIYRKQAA
jgi:ribosomal protein L37E